jgi:hypothetical protein
LIREEVRAVNQEDARRSARRAFAPAAVLCVLLTAGCAGQRQMTDLWRDPSFTSGPVRNVLVVALRRDPVRRRMWEDAFVKELGGRGVTATPSYQLYPAAVPDTQDVIEAVRSKGCDAVLVSIRLPDEATTTYVPASVTRQMITTQGYYGAFHTHWRDVLNPGHTEADEVIRVETDLWGGGRLIWSGTLRTLESVGKLSAHSAVSKDIAPVLEAHGMIPGRK